MYTRRMNWKMWLIGLILIYTSMQTNVKSQTTTLEPAAEGDEEEERKETLPESSETSSETSPVASLDETEEGKEEESEKEEEEEEAKEVAPTTNLEITTPSMTTEETVTHVPSSEELGSTKEPTATKESEPRKEEAPELTFALRGDLEKICLLAKFEAELTITYQNKEGKQSVIQSLPRSAKPEGGCTDGKNRTLRLSWGKFTFTMIFSKVARNDDSDEKWAVTEVALSYDTSKKPFVSAINGSKNIARSEDGLKLFETSVGKSYFCQSPEVIKLYETSDQTSDQTKKEAAFIRFKDMKLQPFGVKDGKFSPSHRCSQVVFTETEEVFVQDETVPLAVGLTLAILTLMVVLGFSIYRAYTVRKVDYNSME